MLTVGLSSGICRILFLLADYVGNFRHGHARICVEFPTLLHVPLMPARPYRAAIAALLRVFRTLAG